MHTWYVHVGKNLALRVNSTHLGTLEYKTQQTEYFKQKHLLHYLLYLLLT